MKGSIDLMPVHCSAESKLHREITFFGLSSMHILSTILTMLNFIILHYCVNNYI